MYVLIHHSEIILKGTNIDGVYDGDPNRDSSAKFLPFVSYERYLQDQYNVMDFAAIKLARDQGMPIRIFNFFKHPTVGKYSIDFGNIDEDKIRKILSDHEFSEQRIDNGIARLKGEVVKKGKNKGPVVGKQKSLAGF